MKNGYIMQNCIFGTRLKMSDLCTVSCRFYTYDFIYPVFPGMQPDADRDYLQQYSSSRRMDDVGGTAAVWIFAVFRRKRELLFSGRMENRKYDP